MEKLFESLNKEQLSACESNEKHILILAGAGTGKTRTITARIIYLINRLKIDPSNILAVTFTNKAANEMQERIESFFKLKQNLMIKTFHSFGAFVLRNEFYAAGRNRYFQIFDTEDSKKALVKILEKNDVNKKTAGIYYNLIQKFKQQVEDSQDIEFDELFNLIYEDYNNYLKESNCFDFEDLILEPVKILLQYPEIRQKYSNRFKYLLVDEYQDTNKSQFELLKQIAGMDNHLMVVGDEDQSIYKFRGADITNILNFEKDFPDARVIRLEENYRSTLNILNTANSVIKNNNSRLGKNLYSNHGNGNEIVLVEAANETDEVNKVINEIFENDLDFNNTAVLYRTNNQSRPFEQFFNKNKVPYKIIGSMRFFEREEIKDAVSIIRWLINPDDRIAFTRFVLKFVKGVGAKTLDKFITESEEFSNLYEALMNIEKMNVSGKAKDSLIKLKEVFINKQEVFESFKIKDAVSLYLQESGLVDHYTEFDRVNNTSKCDNLEEFIESLESYGSGIDQFLVLLEEVSLTDFNDNKNTAPCITLLTVHNAKGLEFDNVFITGVEKELFPHRISEADDDLEEERRLFYVAITRAKKNLFISYCRKRNIFGNYVFKGASQFIEELPVNLLKVKSDFNNSDPFSDPEFAPGDVVRHKDYGKGKVIRIKEIRGRHNILVDFWDYSYKEFVLEFTKLEKAED